MINKVKVLFENCYGIRHLDHTFNFAEDKPIVIYAPNGVMKTSFAKTFQDFSANKETTDRVHKSRANRREILDETSSTIDSTAVFVIEPYNQSYRSDRVSTLLVNSVLKKEHDEIYEIIGRRLEDLLKELRNLSGIRTGIDLIFTKDFALPRKDILTALGRLEREVKKGSNPDLAKIKYQEVFNEKVSAFLESPAFLLKIDEYTKNYESLVGKSKYFKKGIFNHNNAATVAKNLKQNGWFDSGHSVTMNSATEAKSIELKSEQELEKVVQDEKNAILSDPALSKSFEEIDKELQKNAELRSFREFLIENQSFIPELKDLVAFKQKVWIEYLHSKESNYTALLEESDKGEERLKKIIEQAKIEATSWLRVIEIFNERFQVPFIVRMSNQDDVILKSEAPNVVFEFKDEDSGGHIPIDEKSLYEVLSNGEKRALYILNTIFEVEARRQASLETLFIVDDIADSFDYKNKYAIIEYLKDISACSEFSMIILSHNFDFYRAACGRLSVPRVNKFHSFKAPSGLKLVQEKYQKNPFATWRDHLHTNAEMMIASIPLARNLAGYCGRTLEEFELTAFLHIKLGTAVQTVQNLENHFNNVFASGVSLAKHGHTVLFLDFLTACCDKIVLETSEVVELEKKIVLAIGIRLKAELFMISSINDQAFVDGILSNQTYRLTEKFRTLFPSEIDNIRVLEQVSTMTPENIHLNSFMYEPILDMSNEGLKQLYVAVGQFGL